MGECYDMDEIDAYYSSIFETTGVMNGDDICNRTGMSHVQELSNVARLPP